MKLSRSPKFSSPLACAVLALFMLSAAAEILHAQSATPATTQPSTALPSEDTVNSFFEQWLGYDKAKSWKIVDIRPSEIPGLAEVNVVIADANGSGQSRLLVSSDGKHALTGEILPFGAKPFEDARVKLDKGVNGFSKGPADAPVTLVEFSDMQCPHCAKANPAVEQLLAVEPNVRFVFQNFPLPMHNWAEKAAGYVDCIARAGKSGDTANDKAGSNSAASTPVSATQNDTLWKFISKTFEDQSNITDANVDEKLKAIATAAGANAERIAACAVTPETKAHIAASTDLGKSVGVNSTPTLYSNGRIISGMPLDAQKKIIEFQMGK
jgi:protein-disulfide isomerase